MHDVAAPPHPSLPPHRVAMGRRRSGWRRVSLGTRLDFTVRSLVNLGIKSEIPTALARTASATTTATTATAWATARTWAAGAIAAGTTAARLAAAGTTATGTAGATSF